MPAVSPVALSAASPVPPSPGAVALVCDRGFEDVLTLGRQNRADPYALHVGPSRWPALLPDGLRIGIAARMGADGRAVVPFDDAGADGLLRALRALDPPPSAVAVCLLHAMRNPAHEQAVAAVIGRAMPGVRVSCSHALPTPPATEFERTVATVRQTWGEARDLPDGRLGGDDDGDGDGARDDNPAPDTPADSFAAQLEALADAMQATLARQAVSSIAREAMDCAVAIFLPDGRMAAQARSLPLLLGSLSPAVRGLLASYPVESMREGDGYLSNDPWAGGTHLPDFTVLRPVLHGGQVRALVACILHQQDVGGLSPGSVPTDATCIQHEGLRIPPVQLWHAGQADAALLRLLRANSRVPDALGGDLAAQWAALEQGCRQVGELIDAMGPPAFDQACRRSLADSEAATRAALARAPDGDYTFSDALDGDGLTPDPVRLQVVLRKRGDTVEVDLRGCDDQTRGPVNASPGAAWAAVSYFARMLASPAAGDAPGAAVASNDGCVAPVRVLTRPGSIVDPLPGAALNARTNLVKLLANALIGAWSRALPGTSPAPNAAVAVVLSLSGERADGSAWVYTEIIASAAGGAPWGEGGSGVATDVGNTRNTPVEVVEAQAPLRMTRVALRRGSGGAGTHAGGCGVVREWLLLEGRGLVNYRGERHHTAAQGAAGGLPGLPGRACIAHADGRVSELAAKARVPWSAGDRLVIETAGAGGWGQLPAGPFPTGPQVAALTHLLDERSPS